MSSEVIQTKPAASGDGPAAMSQAAAQAVTSSKKAAGEDSLSPFTSDDENGKPRK